MSTIYFVTPWYGYFAGGAEAAVRSLAEKLALCGLDIHVMTTCCRSPFDSWWVNTLPSGIEEINGVTVHRFPVNTQGENAYHEANHQVIHQQEVSYAIQEQFVRNSINSDALISYLKSLNLDTCQVIGIPYIQGLIFSAIEALKGQASIISCFHDEPQFYWRTTQEFLMNSRKIFFLTEEEKDLAIRYYGHLVGKKLIESNVIGLGVDLISDDQRSDIDRMALLRKKHILPQNYFIYAGRKDRGKNILKLIDYFQYYAASNKDVKLVFLGDGDASLVPRKNIFIDLGFVSEIEKYTLISHAIGLINLSELESFSLVIFEAWLCGVPVVTSAACEVTASHCKKSNGGLPVSSRKEFSRALSLLKRDVSLRQLLAANGKNYTLSNYSWNVVLDRFIDGII